ncbi:MAG: hypothetical protein JNL93_20635 [Pelomonas sp.]|nr:hypothetical protein [Roseateles sp.]
MTFVRILVALALSFTVSAEAIADAPRGFRNDWRRAETAVTDALDAVRGGEADDAQDAGKTAGDALLNLAAYANDVPADRRAAYAQALSETRVALQQSLLLSAPKTKEQAVAALQSVLQRIATARSIVPADWFRPDVCMGIRKQRHQC